MIKNLLLTAVRSLGKNKFFSALNILGLATGMAVFLLIAQYVHFEKSYEDFIPGKENIYRVKLEAFRGNEKIMASAENYPGVVPAMKNDFPEVIDYARLYNLGYKNSVVITYKDAKPEPIAVKQTRFLYADSSFLPLMGYEMIKGNASTALVQPLTAVISEEYARIYFKNEDPIGKTLTLQDDDFNYELAKVTGVFKNLPPNTHLKFDVLFSYKTLYQRSERAESRYNNNWQRKDMYSFVKLRAGTDPGKIDAKFPGLINKYKPELKQSQEKIALSLQPLSDIHLKSDLAEEFEINGNEKIVLFMGIIAIFVLLIAWINYVNLSTARALERAKEVGVRKVIGAFKKQLVTQFMVEAALVNLLSVAFAWLLALFVLPWFNTLSGQSLTTSYFLQPWFLLLIATLWIGGTFLSGIYPAFVLSSFKPVVVLKGKMKNSERGILLRKGLVVTQFMASIVLIAGTIIVYRQLNFMMKYDLGMNIDQVLVVQRPGVADTSEVKFNSSIDLFRNEVKKHPSIESLSAALTVPGKLREYKIIVKRVGSGTNDSTIMRFNRVDYDFLKVFKMKMLAGRMFAPEFPNDPDTSVIITASSLRALNFKNPDDALGKSIVVPAFGNFKAIIVGIVNDFHQVSLKKTVEPTLFVCNDDSGDEYFTMRVKTNNLASTVDHVQSSWARAFPGNPFEYFFLDDYFNQQYSNERKFGKLFTSFAILAILIGCIGLFGLSSYMATQRIKEIGIRKVLGASVPNIVTMLSKDFIKLILVAIIIATPLSWFIMYRWLQDFAYRVNIGWWVFAVAGFAALFIATITISYQAVKAALMNPVKSLRTE